jgi:ADP-ribosylglycohydrolase
MGISRQERIAGGLWGLLIGDALGVPYEFHPRHALPPLEAIEFDPPAGFGRSHPGVSPGVWSDDGAQALILLDSLLSQGHFSASHFARGLIAWLTNGFMAVDGVVFDVGAQTSAAIRSLQRGAAPETAGGRDEYDNGNGSLMRVLPLALWHQGDDRALIDDAFAQSAVTHGHPRAQLCCALYCLWARRIMAEAADPWREAVATLRHLLHDDRSREEFESNIAPDDFHEPRGSGYVVDCLFSARFALIAPDFETAVRRAVALGEDTDTTACVAGGIAGLTYGASGIPQRWLNQLKGKDIVQPLLQKLIQRFSWSAL